MGKKAKTRFQIEAAGNVSELFSVMQTSSGDLLLLHKRPNQLGPGVDFTDLDEWRVSAHVSPDSSGTTFVTHLVHADKHIKAHAFFTPRNSRIFALVCAYACPDLSAENYRSMPNKGDDLVLLDSYDPRCATLTYFTVISTAGYSMEGITPFNCVIRQYKHFTVSVLWLYQQLPSFQQGSLMIPATAIGEWKGRNHRSMSRMEITNLIKNKLLTELSRSQLNKIKNKFFKKKNKLPEGSELASRTYSLQSGNYGDTSLNP